MKKSKFIAAALATTMFATAACGLVACDKDAGGLGTQTPDTPTGKSYTITFNPGAGATLKGNSSGTTLTIKTGNDGKLTGTMPEGEKADHTFTGWALTSSATTAVITKTNYTSYLFTKDTTVYAVYTANGGGGGGGEGQTGVYTIRFDYGAGYGSPASAQTANGLLSSLPIPSAPDNYTFNGWWTAAVGGVPVTINTTYTAGGTIYAQYTPTGGGGGGGGGQTDPSHSIDGLYSGDTLLGALEVNGGNETAGCTEYWFGSGQSVQLTQGDTLSFYLSGTQLTNIYSPQGIVGDGSGDSPSSVFTVQASGNYKVYLKLWADSGNYTVEFAKDADIGDVTTLPSESCRVTISDSSTSIVLYFVDANGSPVTLSKYNIWAWADSGNVLAADWDNRPVMSANLSATNALGAKISFKITEGSTESNNVEGVATGKIYVVTIGANLQLDISEYTGN